MYEITITKREPVIRRKQTYEKVSDTGNPKDGGVVYGYVQYDSPETAEVDVLKQTLEDIDLPAVIKAINKI